MEYNGNPLDQPEQNPQNPNPPVPVGRVALINFGIMLAYMLLTAALSAGQNEAGLASLIFDAMLLTAQVGINIVVGVILLFTRNPHIGKAMLLSGLLVGIIGFGVCFGKASLYG